MSRGLQTTSINRAAPPHHSISFLRQVLLVGLSAVCLAGCIASPSSTPAAPPTRDVHLEFDLALAPVTSGLNQPTYVTSAGDGTGRLFAVEQAGRIRVIANGHLFEPPLLDIHDRVSTAINERGLFSVAFPPNFRANGYFYIDYTRKPDGATVVARYRISAEDANQAEPASAANILVIEQPEPNHNGGQLQFGPDGYLYVGMGDGGGVGDQHGPIGNAQTPATLLGKILRLDVHDTSAATYTLPIDNPFLKRPNTRPEIWALGLRNPWRFSFDRVTGDLYIADVGQNLFEEIDFQAAHDHGGENYGWRIMEGTHCYNASACDSTGLTPPAAEYDHPQGCAVTGGYVYRGAAYLWLQGLYFFGDYCTGALWSLERDAAGHWQMVKQLDTDLLISSFGEDEAGELYVVDHHGAIYRLQARLK
jgi:glucose/arabinose dehydrogenase